MLYIKNLNAFYGDIQALRSVSLHVRQGETVALIGGNGAGKSTILNCISRTLTSVCGQITFKDHDLTHFRYDQAVSMGIVHVPEGRCIFPDMSIWDNLVLGAYSKKGKSYLIKERLLAVLDLLPILKNRKSQAGGTLSGG
ncbi:MAG: ATP-binding cassette domain-containing protein, partial [Candidatus Aureabacteria bacterium]|nr:ATP-binding cassette domain-containing protein [Candidatus Auribacterota bacterium]